MGRIQRGCDPLLNLEKKLIMKLLHFFVIAYCSLMFISCKNQIATTSDKSTLPELLNRPHMIGPEEEMGYIQDTYTSLVNKIKADPSDVESRLTLAELFMMEARISGEHGHYYPAALEVIDGAMEREIDEALKYRALLDKASILLSLHQFQEAKKIGEQALSINAFSADAYGVLVDANVELGDYEKAVEFADQMTAIRPDLRSYSRVSYLREIHGDIPGAIEAMQMAVTAGYPGLESTEWARLTLGELYEKYGKPDSAIIQYETALSIRSNYPFAIAALAKIHKSLGHDKIADSLNAHASYLIPEVGFFIDKAIWEKENGNDKEAKKLANEIIAMLEDDEKAGHIMNIEMARVHLELLGNDKKALEYATKEYTVRPNNIDVNHLMAEIYFHQNQFQKANEHLTKAMLTGTKDPEVKLLSEKLMAKSKSGEEKNI